MCWQKSSFCALFSAAEERGHLRLTPGHPSQGPGLKFSFLPGLCCLPALKIPPDSTTEVGRDHSSFLWVSHFVVLRCSGEACAAQEGSEELSEACVDKGGVVVSLVT